VSDGRPQGDEYEWFQRAQALLEQGNSDAACLLLARLRDVEPNSASILEALARALFDSRRYEESAEMFRDLLRISPDNDYAHFGLGLSLWRLQEFPEARDELGMACVMRPERHEYAQALTQVKATLRARAEAGQSLTGPVGVVPPINIYPVDE